jgi:hypothetical protein
MDSQKWYKGNLHTHTTESDGDADPDVVVEWYKQHGYDFLVLSDHNHRTILDHPVEDGPLMIPGEEITANIQSGAIHINGIGISRVVEPIDADEIVPTIQANVDAIRQAGGVVSINHPNYKWAFDHTHISQITGAHLVEIFNGNHGANNNGGPGKFSAEEIWDGVLSTGKRIFGVATDDSHHYFDFAKDRHNPGRGWVFVEAEELTSNAIVNGLATGRFYASTGVTLERLNTTEDSIELKILQDSTELYLTTFSGANGVIYEEIEGLECSYSIKDQKDYVRATVVSSNGYKAWTQPIFPSRE